MAENIESMQKEDRSFAPAPAFSAKALVKSLADYDKLYR